MGLLRELWDFAKTNKKFWLLPVIFALVLLAALMVLTESSVIAPFIYTLF